MPSCLELSGSVLFLKYCPTEPIFKNDSPNYILKPINSRPVLILFPLISLDLADGLVPVSFPSNTSKYDDRSYYLLQKKTYLIQRPHSAAGSNFRLIISR